MNLRKKKDEGFTLVELIIVIAILAVLAGIIGLSVTRYIEKARKTMIYNEAKTMYDQCQRSIAEFGGVTWNGRDVDLSTGLNKVDPVYGQCGRISNLSCYNEMGNKNIGKVKTAASYVDQYMAKGMCEAFPEFSKNDYAGASPNGKTIKEIESNSTYAGKFCFICCYDADGCLYVEVYHRGYFVHFDGETTVDDVVNCRKDDSVAFSDVH